MTIQELEQQVLSLDLTDRIHILQVLAQSLTTSTNTLSSSTQTHQDLADFFRSSPLAEAIVSGALDLTRDKTIDPHRLVL